MAAPRLPSALLMAAAIHAAIASALALVKPRAARSDASVETAIELEDDSIAPESPPSQESPAPVSIVLRLATRRIEHQTIAPSSVASNVKHEASTAPAEVAASPIGSAVTPKASINLGLGDYWKNVASAALLAPEGPVNPIVPPGSQVQRSVRDALSARDFGRGLGAGGSIVTAAHEAASSETAPDTGSATFDVESDPGGRVRSVSVSSFNGGDSRRWTDVANALLTLLTPKRLRVISDGSGLRVRLHVSIDRALPGGEKATTSLGAVPDDVPGSDPVCVGVGLERKCLKGLPIGITLNSADIHNAGARAGRVVRAWVVAEESVRDL